LAVGTTSLEVNIHTNSSLSFLIWVNPIFYRKLHLCLTDQFYIAQVCLQLLLYYWPYFPSEFIPSVFSKCL
jgi:hypothetical protein